MSKVSKMSKMPKIKETLRSIFFYKIDRSTQRLSTGRIPQF
jgi:hypothetical protein